MKQEHLNKAIQIDNRKHNFFSILVINHCIEFDMQCNTCTVPHAVSTVIIICYRMWVLSETQSVQKTEQGGIFQSLWCHFQFAIVFVGWSYNLLSSFMHFCFGEVNALYVCVSVCSQNEKSYAVSLVASINIILYVLFSPQTF